MSQFCWNCYIIYFLWRIESLKTAVCVCAGTVRRRAGSCSGCVPVSFLPVTSSYLTSRGFYSRRNIIRWRLTACRDCRKLYGENTPSPHAHAFNVSTAYLYCKDTPIYCRIYHKRETLHRLCRRSFSPIYDFILFFIFWQFRKASDLLLFSSFM